MYVTERATQARREIAHNAKQKGRRGGAGGRRERPPCKRNAGNAYKGRCAAGQKTTSMTVTPRGGTGTVNVVAPLPTPVDLEPI